MANTDTLDTMRSLFRMEVTDAAQKLFLLLWHLVGCSPGTIERISSCDLAYDFGKTSDAMRKHLKQLEEADLIVVDRLRGNLVIQVKSPGRGPSPRHFNQRQKNFEFDREIDGENHGQNDRQIDGMDGGESPPKTNHEVRNSIEEVIPVPVLEPIPVHREKPPSTASPPDPTKNPCEPPVVPENDPGKFARKTGGMRDVILAKLEKTGVLTDCERRLLRKLEPVPEEPPRVSRNQEHTYLSNNQESRRSKSNSGGPKILSETLKNVSKTSPLGQPPRDPHVGLRKFVLEQVRSSIPDADPYLAERLAVCCADFGLGKKLLRKWLACGEFKQAKSLPAYVHRCLLREIDERGIAIEEVDFRRKELFGRTPKGAA